MEAVGQGVTEPEGPTQERDVEAEILFQQMEHGFAACPPAGSPAEKRATEPQEKASKEVPERPGLFFSSSFLGCSLFTPRSNTLFFSRRKGDGGPWCLQGQG